MKINQMFGLGDKSLGKFFLISYLIPIAATALAILVEGFPTELATAHISPMVIVVIMAMVHAPTIAAMIVAFGDEGFRGIKDLFLELTHWNFGYKWYLYSLLIFPISILVSQFSMSFYSQSYAPVFSMKILVIGVIFSTLWEEIGWTGYATQRMLKKFSPLKTAILLGVIHTFWHLASDYWGAISYYRELYLYVAHFLLWLIGIVILRIFILWMYVRTRSVVLGWLTHFSYTGGQVVLVSVTISGAETVLWNSAFVLVLLLITVFLFATNNDFRDFCKT